MKRFWFFCRRPTSRPPKDGPLPFRGAVFELKTWPEYYAKILSGEKPFDVRKGSDREYKVDDIVKFLEWDPEKKAYTGASCAFLVTYVMHGPPFLPQDLWVLGLSRHPLATTERQP